MISLSVEKQNIQHGKQIAMNDGLSVDHIEKSIPIVFSSDNYREIYGISNGVGRGTSFHMGCYSSNYTISSFHLYKEETPIVTIALNDYSVLGFNSHHKMLIKIWEDMMSDIFTLNPDELIRKYTSKYHILKPAPNTSWYNLLLNMVDTLCGSHTIYDDIMARIPFNYRDEPISISHDMVKWMEIMLKNVQITLYKE